MIFFLLFSGCATNPVTGKRELDLVSEAAEIQLGTENYAFMQQAGGGELDIDPQLTTYVSGVGQQLAAVSDRQLPYEFAVLNSSVPNAWALPGGKIAINRGLLYEMETEAELAAVLSHEIVHAAAGHSAQQMERGLLLQVAMIGTAIMASDSDYANLAMGGANIAAQLITQKYGRSAELESDLYGMRYMSKAGYDPQGAVDLQQTFVRLSEGRRENWLTGLFSSHPPSMERVAANERTAAGLPPGGEVGAMRYEQAMQKARKTKPAYDAYDEGRKALVNKNRELARSKAAEAVRLFPEEAHFYSLLGDIDFVAEDYGEAIESYDDAIQRRDDFFHYYLQRGLARQRLGQERTAVADLRKSNELFPTDVAHNALGVIAVRQGRKADAIAHFSLVAGGQGEVAQAALESLVRLDLPDNPGKYLQVRCYQDDNGNLGVSVGNGTPVTVRGVRFFVELRTRAGIERREGSVPGTIRPGQSASVSTRIGPYPPGAGCPVQVSAARVLQ
jgi:predicted Zn-dependent protease